MPTAFDDLIPAQANAFADLVPQAGAVPVRDITGPKYDAKGGYVPNPEDFGEYSTLGPTQATLENPPLIPLPRFKGETTLGKVGAGLANVGIGAAEFVETPMGLPTALLGPLVPELAPLMKGVFAGLAAKQAGQQTGAAVESGDLQELVEGLGNVGLAGAIATPELPSYRPLAKATEEGPMLYQKDLVAAVDAVRKANQQRWAQEAAQQPAPQPQALPPEPAPPSATVPIPAVQGRLDTGTGVPVVSLPETYVPKVAEDILHEDPNLVQASVERTQLEKPASDVQDVRPAIRMMDGSVRVGGKGVAHDDIINQEKITPDKMDRRGFVNVKTGEWIDREQGPDSGHEVPGMHAAGEESLADLQEQLKAETQPEPYASRGALEQAPVPLDAKPSEPLADAVQAKPEGFTPPPSPPIAERIVEAAKPESIVKEPLFGMADQGLRHDMQAVEAAVKFGEKGNHLTPEEASAFRQRAKELALAANKDLPLAEARSKAAELHKELQGKNASPEVEALLKGNPAYPFIEELEGPNPLVEDPELQRIAAKVADPKGDRLTAEEIAKLPKQGTKQRTDYSAEVERQKARNKELAKLLKPKGSPETVQPLPHRGTQHSDDTVHIKKLGIQEGDRVTDGLQSLIQNEREYGKQRSALAQFLLDKFGHVLGSSRIDFGVGRGRLANYDPKTHTTHLGVNRSIQGKGHTTFAAVELPERLLHEGAHAATVYQLSFGDPKLIGRLNEILTQSKLRLPAESDLSYNHSKLEEFVAGFFDNPGLREHLSKFTVGGRTLWQQGWEAVKQLLGIEPHSAADEMMDIIGEMGDQRYDLNEARRSLNFDPVNAPTTIRNAAVMEELTSGDRFNEWWNRRKGFTVPNHVAVNEAVGNKLARWASADIAKAPMAKWMATDTLGEHWQHKGIDRSVGMVIIEDMLNQLRDEHIAAGDPATAAKVLHVWQMPGANISEKTFNGLKTRPEIVDIINRHKQGPQTYIEQKHTELGGATASGGKETGAFLNLQAVLDPENPAAVNNIVYAQGKGVLTNPLIKGSAFNKQRKGTGRSYEFSYRQLLERAIRGNFVEYAKEQYYKEATEAGLAFLQKPESTGGITPLPQGVGPKTHVPTEIIRKGAGPGMTRREVFWLRKDLHPEFNQVRQTDSPLQKAALSFLADATTSLQVMGPTDLTFHGVNMLADIATSQGSRSMMYDVIRKTTPIGFVDALVRTGWNMMEVFKDSPELQEREARIAEIGAGRSYERPKDFVQRGLEKIKPGLEKITPEYWSQRLIQLIDRGGRVAKDKMFDNLVQRNLVEDTEINRREFIDQLGQYNSRLMPRIQAAMRESGVAPFVVAGRTMNRNAIRNLFAGFGTSSLKTVNPNAYAKMRLVDSLGVVSMLYALPITANLIMTGKPFGRPGTQPGAVDLGGPVGPDGKHKTFDPLQLILLRRATRLTGFQAVRESQQEGLGTKATVNKVAHDLFAAWVHPWAGPAVRVAKVAITGTDVSGYLESKNPTELSENMLAAARNINPLVKAMLQDPTQGKVGSALESLGKAVGYKDSRTPTLEESGKQSGSLKERRIALQEPRPERGELAKRAAGLRSFWNQYEKEDALKGSLPKSQQQWLEKNRLSLPAFRSEVDKVPLTHKENDLMLEQTKLEYRKAVSKLMMKEAFPALPPERKQKILSAVLTAARNAARVSVRRSRIGQVYPAGTLQMPLEESTSLSQ